jgi:hypothetical protein
MGCGGRGFARGGQAQAQSKATLSLLLLSLENGKKAHKTEGQTHKNSKLHDSLHGSA